MGKLVVGRFDQRSTSEQRLWGLWCSGNAVFQRARERERDSNFPESFGKGWSCESELLSALHKIG
jgi:hypothetical protein